MGTIALRPARACVQRQLESPRAITTPPATPWKRQVDQRLELTKVKPAVAPQVGAVSLRSTNDEGTCLPQRGAPAVTVAALVQRPVEETHIRRIGNRRSLHKPRIHARDVSSRVFLLGMLEPSFDR